MKCEVCLGVKCEVCLLGPCYVRITLISHFPHPTSHFSFKLHFVNFFTILINKKTKTNKIQTDVIKKRKMAYESCPKNSIFAVFLLT